MTDLCTLIKVARDEDLIKQIGKNVYFDLVDHDKVTCFRVQKPTTFNFFKEEAAKKFGVPAHLQRYWVMAKRQNNTCRPYRPLTDIEEAGPVGALKVLNKVHKFELKLFLEVERRQDLYPIAPFETGEDDILLFFKLYDPEKEEIRYVGRLFVNCNHRPSKILKQLNKMAGYDPDEEIELYEEIMSEPNVMCEPVDITLKFVESELENGDILCFQKASATDNTKHFRYPDVPSYLEYVHNRQVLFRPADQNSRVDKETESPVIAKTSKFISTNFKEIDAMIDEDSVAAIDRVLSEGVTISLIYQPSFDRQLVSREDPDFPKQLLKELRDIAFKEDLVEKLKRGFIPKVNLNAFKEIIDANANVFSSSQLEQVRVVVNLLNHIVRMFDELEDLKKQLDSTKMNTDQDNEALKDKKQEILTLKASFPEQDTQLKSLDVHIADLKAKLKKLQCDRSKIVEIQDQKKDKIESLNKEVRSIFHHLADGQIKLKSIEAKIPEAQTELEGYEKVYRSLREIPPF